MTAIISIIKKSALSGKKVFLTNNQALDLVQYIENIEANIIAKESALRSCFNSSAGELGFATSDRQVKLIEDLMG